MSIRYLEYGYNLQNLWVNLSIGRCWKKNCGEKLCRNPLEIYQFPPPIFSSNFCVLGGIFNFKIDKWGVIFEDQKVSNLLMIYQMMWRWIFNEWFWISMSLLPKKIISKHLLTQNIIFLSFPEAIIFKQQSVPMTVKKRIKCPFPLHRNSGQTPVNYQ